MRSKLRTLADWARANIRLLLLAYGLPLLEVAKARKNG